MSFFLAQKRDSFLMLSMICSAASKVMADSLSSPASEAAIPQPKAADWLWRPWYAKLWWTAIPLYWGAAIASLKVPAMSPFFDRAFAGYLNMLFFPFTALLVLGFGFVHAWLDRPLVGDPRSDEEFEELECMNTEDEEWERLGPHWSVDIYDPRSGGLYIGNPNSLQHPGRRY